MYSVCCFPVKFLPKVPKVTIRTYRRNLASIEAIPQFAILGIASGLVTGLVIIAFRLLIEWPLGFFISDAESFEEMNQLAALLLPVGGSLVLIGLLTLLPSADRQVGVPHVLQRLARHQGHLPLKNVLVQFVTGVVALATGQSGGREGPAIHLGAAGSSLMGHYLRLPNNSIRILVGCGAAAAISASFNTPIAGVIFSMEVVLMEYTLAGFIPVILAAVVAALLTQTVFGSDTAFDVPQVAMASYLDLPVLLVEGVVVGVVAALFVHALHQAGRYAPGTLWARLLLAGLVTGLAAIFMPQVMGVGYDTVNDAIAGNLAFKVLLAVAALKLLTSAISIAMGVPIGLIGPTLFIGAMVGGLVAVAAGLVPGEVSEPAFYATLGMGAMMGAVLQAPLAALMAVLELTNNPNIILPAMLVIIVASMTASQVFGIRSIFVMQMEWLGMEFRQGPLALTLNRASVASIMIRNFTRVDTHLTEDEARLLLERPPQWLLVDMDGAPRFVMPTEDLADCLASGQTADIDLSQIPAHRKDVTGVILQATLAEALDALNESGVQALYVNRFSAPGAASPVGIVMREDIESWYGS